MRAILTYHSIDSSGSSISIDREIFDRQVAWLASGRIAVTTIDKLLSLPESADAAAITFDDGFANFGEIAAPRLYEHGLPSTVFVVTDSVGTTNAWRGRTERDIPHLPLLDWSALARLQERGVVLGAHTRTHPDLRRLARADVEDEVSGSADRIHRETGTRPAVFAYPYGRYTEQTAEIVANAFRYACTTEFGPLEGSPRMRALPRIDMYYFRDCGQIEGWGTPRLNRFIRRRRKLRAVRRWFLDRANGM